LADAAQQFFRQLQQANTDNNALQQRIKSACGERDTLEGSNRDMYARLKTRCQELEDIRAECRGLEVLADRRKDEIINLNAACQRHNGSNNELRQQMGACEQALADQRNRATDARAQADALQSKYAAVAASMAAAKQGFEAEIHNLKQQLTAAAAAQAAASESDRVSQLKGTLASTANTVETLTADNKRLAADNKRFEVDHERLAQQLSTMRAAMTAMQASQRDQWGPRDVSLSSPRTTSLSSSQSCPTTPTVVAGTAPATKSAAAAATKSAAVTATPESKSPPARNQKPSKPKKAKKKKKKAATTDPNGMSADDFDSALRETLTPAQRQEDLRACVERLTRENAALRTQAASGGGNRRRTKSDMQLKNLAEQIERACHMLRPGGYADAVPAAEHARAALDVLDTHINTHLVGAIRRLMTMMLWMCNNDLRSVSEEADMVNKNNATPTRLKEVVDRLVRRMEGFRLSYEGMKRRMEGTSFIYSEKQLAAMAEMLLDGVTRCGSYLVDMCVLFSTCIADDAGDDGTDAGVRVRTILEHWTAFANDRRAEHRGDGLDMAFLDMGELEVRDLAAAIRDSGVFSIVLRNLLQMGQCTAGLVRRGLVAVNFHVDTWLRVVCDSARPSVSLAIERLVRRFVELAACDDGDLHGIVKAAKASQAAKARSLVRMLEATVATSVDAGIQKALKVVCNGDRDMGVSTHCATGDTDATAAARLGELVRDHNASGKHKYPMAKGGYAVDRDKCGGDGVAHLVGALHAPDALDAADDRTSGYSEFGVDAVNDVASGKLPLKGLNIEMQDRVQSHMIHAALNVGCGTESDDGDNDDDDDGADSKQPVSATVAEVVAEVQAYGSGTAAPPSGGGGPAVGLPEADASANARPGTQVLKGQLAREPVDPLQLARSPANSPAESRRAQLKPTERWGKSTGHRHMPALAAVGELDPLL
jgi:hypothetical protein